jgi:bacterioferritin-associated ferredoxin
MIVCICRGVPDHVVRLVVVQGAQTVGEVGEACAAGRGCGSCHEAIDELIQKVCAGSCEDCAAPEVRLRSLAAG